MNTKKKIAVVLCGCGSRDGSEIHEAVLTMYAIAKNGADYQLFAPDVPQHNVINHVTGKEMEQSRNVYIESARIARGEITRLIEFEATEFDAVIFPGGFGVAKNLSTWAFDGPDAYINEEVKKCILDMVAAEKPMGALCIAPVLFALVLKKVNLTIGNDPETIENLKKTGAINHEKTHGEIFVDKKYKLVTTPCYMLDANIAQIGDGAEAVVRKVLELVG